MAHLNRVEERREGDLILRALPTGQMDGAEVSGSGWGRYRFRSHDRFELPDQWGNVASARRDCGKRRAADDGLADDLATDPDFPTVARALARKAAS